MTRIELTTEQGNSLSMGIAGTIIGESLIIEGPDFELVITGVTAGARLIGKLQSTEHASKQVLNIDIGDDTDE